MWCLKNEAFFECPYLVEKSNIFAIICFTESKKKDLNRFASSLVAKIRHLSKHIFYFSSSSFGLINFSCEKTANTDGVKLHNIDKDEVLSVIRRSFVSLRLFFSSFWCKLIYFLIV